MRDLFLHKEVLIDLHVSNLYRNIWTCDEEIFYGRSCNTDFPSVIHCCQPFTLSVEILGHEVDFLAVVYKSNYQISHISDPYLSFGSCTCSVRLHIMGVRQFVLQSCIGHQHDIFVHLYVGTTSLPIGLVIYGRRSVPASNLWKFSK